VSFLPAPLQNSQILMLIALSEDVKRWLYKY